MTQEEVLLAVTTKLDSLGIPYAITGSFASNMWGYSRFTHDADILISPSGVSPAKIHKAFKTEFYVSPGAISQAIRRGSMFNLIHLRSSFKVDLWIADPVEFSGECIKRRQRATLGGKAVYSLSPSDVVLSKLIWYRKTGSRRQIDDAVGVLQVSATHIDRVALVAAARELGLSDVLREALEAADA